MILIETIDYVSRLQRLIIRDVPADEVALAVAAESDEAKVTPNN